jgi:hypothetical protein
VEWSQQFEKPCIVFEDLKEMRDSIDYGTRMNRRLHHLPFRALQYYTSYKTVFKSVPTAWIPPNTRAVSDVWTHGASEPPQKTVQMSVVPASRSRRPKCKHQRRCARH